MLKGMPAAGAIVIVVILVLFVLAVALLIYVWLRYQRLGEETAEKDKGGFLTALREEYAAAFAQYGQEVNTPALITDAVSTHLKRLLVCERFLNNAVSLFVTLGLFGTFLGLSLSVASLTELIGYSNTDQWLSVLDSVGEGLMSALGGMGVAFYTSLVGAGCSILLTILRTILNPQSQRERLTNRLELWLDTEIAPTLAVSAGSDDASLVRRMIAALDAASKEMQGSLRMASDNYAAVSKASAESYAAVTKAAADALRAAMQDTGDALTRFDETVGKFNEGVHDFSEVDYNLRGSVERMDLAVRDLASTLREVHRRMNGELA